MGKNHNKLDVYTKALEDSCKNLVNLIMDYWDIIPDKEKVELAKKLDEIEEVVRIAIKKLLKKRK